MTALHLAPTPYHAIQAVNWSTLRHMRRSPLHYRHAEQNQRPDSDTFRRGRLVHTLVLEPDRRDHEYAVWGTSAAEETLASLPPAKGPAPKVTTRRQGKLWDTFAARNAHKTIVTLDQWLAAEAMADAVRAVWTPDEQRECAIAWTNPETGLRCKGRFDSMSTTTITEIKTTRNVAADFMSRTLHNYDYHCQLAHYRMGMKALTGRDYTCRIVAVEAEAPHDVAVFEIDEEALLAGEMDVSALLRRVVECRASGVWPGRYTDPQVLTLPRWATKDDDEDLTGLGLLMPADDDEENEEV